MIRSIESTGGNGSSFSFSRIRRPWKPWYPAYPETTGYIIETLYDYSAHFWEIPLGKYALDCSEWLLSIQKDNGSFPALLDPKGKPSVFNTAMILFGLRRSYLETGYERFFAAADQACSWLVEVLDKDFLWTRFAYVEGYVPTYYTRAIWSVLEWAKDLSRAAWVHAMENALSKLFTRYDRKGKQFSDWGFHPNRPAFTHTIAYTLRGFMEAGLILKNEVILSVVDEILARLADEYARFGLMPGSFARDWKADKSFTCVTGNAQLASIYFRRARHRNLEGLWEIGEILLGDVRRSVRKGKFEKQLEGAVPGSVPFHGKYMRWHHPNWAAKFYLDAEWDHEMLQNFDQPLSTSMSQVENSN